MFVRTLAARGTSRRGLFRFFRGPADIHAGLRSGRTQPAVVLNHHASARETARRPIYGKRRVLTDSCCAIPQSDGDRTDCPVQFCCQRISANHGDAQYARDTHQCRFDDPGRLRRLHGFQQQRRPLLEGELVGELYATHFSEVRHAEFRSRQRGHSERKTLPHPQERRKQREPADDGLLREQIVPHG